MHYPAILLEPGLAFRISFATLLKWLEYSWDEVMSRWRIYLQMLIWMGTNQLSFVSLHGLWHLFCALHKVSYLSFSLPRCSCKWEWRVWWLECLQPSPFHWRALQWPCSASCWALWWPCSAKSWPASSSFKFFWPLWFDGFLPSHHDLLPKHEFLYDGV